MATTREAYEKLVKKRKEITAFNEIDSLLQWDQGVNMPPKGGAQRGEQLAAVSGVTHDLKTSKELGEILKQLESSDLKDFTDMEKAVIRDSLRDYKRETAIPRDLATKLAKLGADSYTAWISARTKNDFSIFKPFLVEWVKLSREKAKLIDPELDCYDVLMDKWERGLSRKILDPVFAEIKKSLIPLIEEVQSKTAPDDSFLKTQFDLAVQTKVSNQLIKEIGYDTERGRLDVSVHPFTVVAGTVNDVRITTRYNPGDITVGLTASIHEAGHALYEQGLNPEFASILAGQAVSMGIHESQSLFWERMVGKGEHFWKKYWPLLQENFPELKNATSEQFYKAYNKVKPGFIRVEADELSYPLHVILRYEIELGLINGEIEVDDNLPKLWDDKMKEYLKVTPTDYKVGILQDIHWSMGYWGYFPTYTLGAIYASQFYKTAKEQIPDLEEQIARGEFQKLKQWLNEKIHSVGSLHPGGDQLCKLVTGDGLNASAFIKYLEEKYRKIYS